MKIQWFGSLAHHCDGHGQWSWSKPYTHYVWGQAHVEKCWIKGMGHGLETVLGASNSCLWWGILHGEDWEDEILKGKVSWIGWGAYLQKQELPSTMGFLLQQIRQPSPGEVEQLDWIADLEQRPSHLVLTPGRSHRGQHWPAFTACAVS